MHNCSIEKKKQPIATKLNERVRFESGSWKMEQMQKIENDIKKFGYRNKFYELTQTHVFYFDISKVISNQYLPSINKLCGNLFRYLVVRLIYFYYEQGRLDIINNVISSQNKNPSKILLKKAVSIENEPYGKQLRQNKSRANTTLGVIQMGKRGGSQQKQLNRKGLAASTVNVRTQKELSQKGEQKQFENACQNEQQFVVRKILQINEELRESYFQLTQSINNKCRVAKIQIICFLIALISPQILRNFNNTVQRQLKIKSLKQIPEQGQSNPKQQLGNECFSIQQQVYIVLTYHTLGNLVSPTVFNCLKKKYIKQTIYQSVTNYEYSKLIRSLKHIKQRLNSQKNLVLIKGRRQRQKLRKVRSIKLQEDENSFTKQKMKVFIKQSLKMNEVAETTQQLQKQMNQHSRLKQNKQNFYPCFSHMNSIPLKLALTKQSPVMKNSISIKSKLNLENFKQPKQNKQLKRKKYITNTQKTFYKLKSNHEEDRLKKQNLIKSQRSSYKFNKLIGEISPNIHLQKSKSKFDLPLEQMKIRISKFKHQALKDLQIIQQFKPSTSFNDLRKQFNAQERNSFRQNMFIKIDQISRAKPLQSQKILTEKVLGVYGNFDLRFSNNQKQQMWHEMYNIRSEPKTSQPASPTNVSMSYKLSRNSDKLKKYRQIFDEDCRKRLDFIGDDLDVIQKIKMKGS